MLGYSRRCFGGPIRKMLSIFDFDPVCTFWFIAIITILVFFCIWLRNPHLGPFLSFGTSDCKGCRTSIKPTKAHPWSMTHFEPLLVQVYSLVITARRMQVATHASAEIAVCLSVCVSVTCVLCGKTKQCTADILIPHERAITLFWHQRPVHLKFALKITHLNSKNADFDRFPLTMSQP